MHIRQQIRQIVRIHRIAQRRHQPTSMLNRRCHPLVRGRRATRQRRLLEDSNQRRPMPRLVLTVVVAHSAAALEHCPPQQLRLVQLINRLRTGRHLAPYHARQTTHQHHANSRRNDFLPESFHTLILAPTPKHRYLVRSSNRSDNLVHRIPVRIAAWSVVPHHDRKDHRLPTRALQIAA